jgi:dihydroorotate dehydrogenase
MPFSSSFWDLAQRGLHALDPECAHNLTLTALERTPLSFLPTAQASPMLQVKAFGLAFPNPIGVAAGFDKNARVMPAMHRLGFGFVEVGTLTPRAQVGNPKPRVFRVPQAHAVINRLGFNNEGHAKGLQRLETRAPTGIVGVNIGANKDSPDPIDDYVQGVRLFSHVADYLTINISSPNTKGLRDLQYGAMFDTLLARVFEARHERPSHVQKPILVKIAPDLELTTLDDIVATCRKHNVDGMIVSNTTLARPEGIPTFEGGLSGVPLFESSTRMLAQTYVRVEGAFPLIGVGGVNSAATAWQKICAGATLVQLYTGLIYGGVPLLAEIMDGLEAYAARESMDAARGKEANAWAALIPDGTVLAQ